MKELEYPFDSEWIIKKKKSIKKHLLSEKGDNLITKNVAILGGVTTNDIKQVLELFLLNYGIRSNFYESEYNKYYEDGAFKNVMLEEFKPDIIYVCTSIRNIIKFPCISDSKVDIDSKLNELYERLNFLWNNLKNTYNCPIIQNNFEYPFYRLMGNKDASDIHGRVNFVTRINQMLYDYANHNEGFYICDINYISACYGLDRWVNPSVWYLYKYALDISAIPYLSFNVANIIKSIYGKNKKVLNLDLDNTLWGGVIGDDGAENIEIGKETAIAENYTEFQEYIKSQKDLGVLLTINSKNEESIGLSGFERPDSILKKEDFVNKKINWNAKSENLKQAAYELNLLPESFVFIDDNPAERKIVQDNINGVAVPEIGNVEDYISIIDKSGFFEVTSLSSDDLKRSEMYLENVKREELKNTFLDYSEYLKSLDMHAEIKEFVPIYMSRIAQLSNKSNQFNLTTKRYSQSEIEKISNDKNYITLYGKLVDKFGDNGVVSIVIGKIEGYELHMELWLMSCRVLKRDMEFAMMDKLVLEAKRHKIKKIIGYYYPTAKNSMVKDFYALQGFTKISEDSNGNVKWEYEIPENYENKQNVIGVLD